MRRSLALFTVLFLFSGLTAVRADEPTPAPAPAPALQPPTEGFYVTDGWMCDFTIYNSPTSDAPYVFYTAFPATNHDGISCGIAGSVVKYRLNDDGKTFVSDVFQNTLYYMQPMGPTRFLLNVYTGGDGNWKLYKTFLFTKS